VLSKPARICSGLRSNSYSEWCCVYLISPLQESSSLVVLWVTNSAAVCFQTWRAAALHSSQQHV
jgi:hypothetical protein